MEMGERFVSMIYFRSKPCKNWEETGKCINGKTCGYAHGSKELMKKGEFAIRNSLLHPDSIESLTRQNKKTRSKSQIQEDINDYDYYWGIIRYISEHNNFGESS